MPLIADAMLDSLALLERTCTIFAERCITGIKANEARCRTWMERSPEIVAALIPRIGHERATELARQMRDEGLDLRTVVARTGWITTPDLENALSAETLCALGWRQT
jgi:aspartate ammonia-lyase